MLFKPDDNLLTELLHFNRQQISLQIILFSEPLQLPFKTYCSHSFPIELNFKRREAHSFMRKIFLPRFILTWITIHLPLCQIDFVSNQSHYQILCSCVVFCFIQPSCDTVEWSTRCYVIDQNGCCGSSIVGSSDWLKGLLTCLRLIFVTVSQICSFMGRVLMMIVVEAN